MATAKDFTGLGNIEGVSQYLLVQNDGNIRASNMENGQSTAITIMGSGQHCANLSQHLGGLQYIHLCIERESNNLLVFSLGEYYLGILEEGDRSTQETVNNVISFLKSIVTIQ